MLVKVKNRSNSLCSYTIPELGDKRNIRREFSTGEEKKIDLEELKALTYVPGGKVLLEEYLQIEDGKAIEDLEMRVEPEYNMSIEDIKDLLNNGSLDKLLDCLDFAPDGVIDLIKELSVSMPLNDNEKRNAIKEATGFDVDKALLRNREAKEDAMENTSSKKQRRVVDNEKSTGRRVAVDNATSYNPPKYNYIKK